MQKVAELSGLREDAQPDYTLMVWEPKPTKIRERRDFAETWTLAVGWGDCMRRCGSSERSGTRSAIHRDATFAQARTSSDDYLAS